MNAALSTGPTARQRPDRRPRDGAVRTVSVVAAALLATALISSCGPADDAPAGGRAGASGPEPRTPSVYMQVATSRWNAFTRNGTTPVWPAVTMNGKRWRGDPRTYEKVCGARFLDDDGLFPRGSDDTSWYDDLRSDDDRWAAFNAWLADPAVDQAISGTVTTATRSGQRGGSPALGDPSGCTRRSAAGEPVG